MRGFLVGTLALAVLQALVTGKGPDAAGGLFGYVSTGLQALGDPARPAIPARGGSSKPTSKPKGGGSTPSPTTPPGGSYTPPTTPGGVGTVILPPGGVSYTPPIPNPARSTYA